MFFFVYFSTDYGYLDFFKEGWQMDSTIELKHSASVKETPVVSDIDTLNLR